jgi:tungstate transport system substrate-binding protein
MKVATASGGLQPQRKPLVRLALHSSRVAMIAARTRMELRLWKAADFEAAGEWYRETGQGMGPSLNIASELNAYILTDRATWANFGRKGELEILLEGDPALFDPYSSILINPAKNPAIQAADAKIWHEWITTAPGQKAIESFKIDGRRCFLQGSKSGS